MERISGLISMKFKALNAEDAIEFVEILLDLAALEDVTKLIVIGEIIGR